MLWTLAVLLVATAIAALLSYQPAGRNFSADFIITNCTIWTADENIPWAESMAVSRGRILRLGSVAHVKEVAGSNTEYMNLHGKFVAPGFIDSHVHFIPGGLQLARLDLHHVRSVSEFVSEVQKAAAALGDDDGWLIGFGWSNEHWEGGWPNSSWIDEVTGDHPVWLSRIDGHMGLANKVALEKCHLIDHKEDPPGGTIIRNEDGVPTGLLVDAAMLLVSSCLPKSSLEQRREALARANKHAASNGITSVVDFGSYFPGGAAEDAWNDLNEVYAWADAVGNLTVRSALFLPLETWPRVAALIREKGEALSNWVHIRGVKAFADGSLGSGTALFHEPYADDPSNAGLRVTELDKLVQLVNAASQSNIQVAVHAIGDRAVDDVLSIYGDIVSKDPHQTHRLRVEHAQHLSPGAHAKFSETGTIASVQPEQLLDDASYVTRKLGEERSRRSYNFASLLRSGTVICLGSDWPVAALDPLGGMAAAVKRTPDGWEAPWLPEEKISAADALTGYTISAAYAAGLDHLVGSFKAGKLADFVVLSGSPLDDSPEQLQVVSTFVGGFRSFSSTGIESCQSHRGRCTGQKCC